MSNFRRRTSSSASSPRPRVVTLNPSIWSTLAQPSRSVRSSSTIRRLRLDLTSAEMDNGSLAASLSPAASERPESPRTAAEDDDDIDKLLEERGATAHERTVAPIHQDWITVTKSPNSRYCEKDAADSSVGRPTVCRHNERMLPTSYSIAGWQHWLCITFDTVWCITSTRLVKLGGGALRARPRSEER